MLVWFALPLLRFAYRLRSVGVSEPPRGFEGESVLTIGDIPRQQGDDDAQDRGDFNNVFETSDLVIATLRHADLAM